MARLFVALALPVAVAIPVQAPGYLTKAWVEAGPEPSSPFMVLPPVVATPTITESEEAKPAGTAPNPCRRAWGVEIEGRLLFEQARRSVDLARLGLASHAIEVALLNDALTAQVPLDPLAQAAGLDALRGALPSGTLTDLETTTTSLLEAVPNLDVRLVQDQVYYEVVRVQDYVIVTDGVLIPPGMAIQPLEICVPHDAQTILQGMPGYVDRLVDSTFAQEGSGWYTDGLPYLVIDGL
jgi:hypothetical protein